MTPNADGVLVMSLYMNVFCICQLFPYSLIANITFNDMVSDFKQVVNDTL